jgi:urea carboxylase-associated protein 1
VAVSDLKEKVLINETIQPGEHWDKVLSLGQFLKITDVCGQQGVDFLCYNAQNPKERYHAPNTMKAARNIRISKGSVLYSDYARPLMTVVEDTTKGGHDTIAGCCSAWSNELLYGVPNVPGCRENFLSALAKHDLGWQDIVPNINFFCSVPVYEDGHTEDSVFVNGRSVAGDYVELRAETDVLAIISNCPQVNNPCNSGNPTEIRVQVYER